MSKAEPNVVAAEAEAPSHITPIKRAAREKSLKSQPATVASEPATEITATAALVVFGRDDAGKPHASLFGAADAELAIKAAGLMRFRVLPITTDEHRAVASGLAQGRIFASGRGFVPFCKEGAYTGFAAFPEALSAASPRRTRARTRAGRKGGAEYLGRHSAGLARAGLSRRR